MAAPEENTENAEQILKRIDAVVLEGYGLPARVEHETLGILPRISAIYAIFVQTISAGGGRCLFLPLRANLCRI